MIPCKRLNLVFLLLSVGLRISYASELGSSRDFRKWDLDILTNQRTCEAVLVGRLVPIELLGQAHTDRDYFLIIAEEVLYGSFEKGSVLDVPVGGIEMRDEKQERELADFHRSKGRKVMEGRWARSFGRRRYLIFLRSETFDISTYYGFRNYELVGGLSGVVGLQVSCSERRSRLGIEKQYDIAMDRYAIALPPHNENDGHAFLDAVKFYLAEKSYSNKEIVTEEMVLSDAAKKIYDKLVSRKPKEWGGEKVE